ncbi:XRE family transcriptional regulator [Rummeliibacillus sp. TYF005]|uniref:helix-turn-helix transcriptional regulator n=1 Tax=Rummeliibacillus sp. TYF005 TaxID=2058214 RepID=UPI000F543DFC|nr:helix-turn-helix transcriptional regulator [Rummeliibacillus sp. TYF005]RPJ97251.1 XRE family transcriptional regulator [Rummeliibacillus sp. TYF005]
MKDQISKKLLADKVKGKRGNRTLLDMEKITGVNSNIINNVENGKYIPSAPQLNQLLDKLHINISEILINEEKQNVFSKLLDRANTEQEREGFEKLISMMLCLRKYERLRELDMNFKI